jgi:hypothetical protein
LQSFYIIAATMNMSDDDSRSSMTPTASADENGSSPVVSPDDKQGVKDPAANDVLCGRGGSINSHPGNEVFRTLVEKRKRVYLTARFKREKRLIASSIVSEIRELKGRFLQRDSKSGLWKDIGDEKARDKTSQALRENAPSIRAEIEEEINEQRAELYKDEPSPSHLPTYPPPTSSGYYSSWYPSYYGYSSHPPPPPQHGVHPYPPPPHSAYPPHHYDYHHYGSTHPEPPYVAPTLPKSTIAETADFISLGAESLKNWTKASFSFGGGASVADTASTNKPIAYKHEDRRKMVKFRDDSFSNKHRRVRPCYSPVQSNNSFGDYDLEPQSVDVDTNTTLMSQVANHILGGFGSWDGVCGTDQSVHDEKMPMPEAQPSAFTQDTETGVEWEGQEVQLVDESKKDEMRMPPPPPPPRESHTGVSIAFSSLGSCHSWFPEQVGAAASYFSGRDDTVSMDMDYSGAGSVGYTAENYSIGESIGGGSLTRVFENEAMPSPTISHRDLNQIPSWERSLRSKSPVSLGDDDDESLMSRCSSRGALSSVPSAGEEMAWTRE